MANDLRRLCCVLTVNWFPGHCEERCDEATSRRSDNQAATSSVMNARGRFEKETMNERVYCVYIMSNDRRTALYTGVTGNLKKRAYEHKEKLGSGFTSRYNINRLVYYETCLDALAAIAREKQIKAGSRRKKISLIEMQNPTWLDLYDDL
jgi:putative endonuclease